VYRVLFPAVPEASVVSDFSHEEEHQRLPLEEPFAIEPCVIRIGKRSLPQVVAQEGEEETEGPPRRKPEKQSQVKGGAWRFQAGTGESGVEEEKIELASILDSVDEGPLGLEIGEQMLLAFEKRSPGRNSFKQTGHQGGGSPLQGTAEIRLRAQGSTLALPVGFRV
jgi:hypothetical protein